MASTEVNSLYPNVIEIDAEREPGIIIRVIRLGDRADRIVLILDEHFCTITLTREGDNLIGGGSDTLHVQPLGSTVRPRRVEDSA